MTLTASAARAVVDSVINNSGVIEANSIGSHNGMIVLGAATAGTKPPGAPTQTVTVSGKLSAKGKRKGTTGGTIIVTGENIAVSGASINASGQAGGGTVLIGGDWGGGHPNTSLVSGNASATLQPYTVPNSSTVSIDAATTIDASATVTGNGGKVIVWANQATTFLGTILAKGGAQSGNGGFVETSGGTLTFNGGVNTFAPNGKTGTWLLDPTDLTIDATGAATISNGLVNNNVVVYTDADGTTSGQGTTTANGLGDIIVTAPISWSSDTTLTLDAYHNVDVDAHITSTGGGNLILRADNSGTDIGTVVFNADSGRISTSGAVSILYNPANNPGNGTINTSSYMTPTNYSQFVTGGTLTSYMLVNNVYDLQNIQNNPSGTYALGTNIDASATANWSGSGFIPIGNSQSPFTGSLNGDGFAISNLTINSAAAYVGLFGMIGSGGSVQNLGIGNISLTATGWTGLGGDYAHVGALAGTNQGTISNSYATGNITSSSPDGTAPDTGGLVGTNAGSINRSYAGVNITESSPGSSLYLGGLVGWNEAGTVTQSYATGTVTNTSDQDASVGGLIGNNTGTVSQSYSSGLVSGAGNLGGLIGNSNGNVTSSYWDTDTSRRNMSAAGSPLTTAQFQSGLPGGFDATVWGIGGLNNGHPYLLWQLPSGTQVIDGYVYADGGITLAGNGIVVSALVNGVSLASLGGTVTTGANGSYNFLLPPGTILASGSQVLTYTTGANAGAAYRQNATGSVTNLNIYEGYLNETGGATTLSGLSAGLATALGSNSSVVSGLDNRAINATGTSFAIDQSLNARNAVAVSKRRGHAIRCAQRHEPRAARRQRELHAHQQRQSGRHARRKRRQPQFHQLDKSEHRHRQRHQRGDGIRRTHAQREWRHRGDRGGKRRHIYASERQLESGHRFAAQLYCPEFRHQWRLVPARRRRRQRVALSDRGRLRPAGHRLQLDAAGGQLCSCQHHRCQRHGEVGTAAPALRRSATAPPISPARSTATATASAA